MIQVCVYLDHLAQKSMVHTASYAYLCLLHIYVCIAT